MKTTRKVVSHALLAFVALNGCGFAAQADDHERASRLPVLPKYRQECASCHVAYPPGMLPAKSWQRLMTNLPRHFGTDASLDAVSAKQIGDWLVANAGTYRRVRDAPPEDRITRSVWFARKHDEVSATVWKRPAVKSPANCSACHAQADQGDFNEHNVRIPR
jgi:hypothetical protein